MRHLARAAVALTAAATMVVTTLSPAEAYYREADDPAGDVRASDCRGVRHVSKLDLTKVDANTFKRGGVWRLTLRAHVATLGSPGRKVRQSVSFNIYERRNRTTSPDVEAVGWRFSSTAGWDAEMAAINPDYPDRNVSARNRGTTFILTGVTLKPNSTYRVWVGAQATKTLRRGTCFYDDHSNRKITDLSTHE